MNLNLKLIDKPTGYSTHAVDKGKPGILEIQSEILKQKLIPVHRLDKETTGCLLAALDTASASEIFEMFKAHKIKKKYLLITDRKIQDSELVHTVEGLIEKDGKSFSFDAKAHPNSKTKFKRIKGNPFFDLWEAEPITGKPHQIRLHAEHLGIPILGDKAHGGSEFPHLCLHSLELEVPGIGKFTCDEPLFFRRLGLLKLPTAVTLLSAADRRQRLLGFLTKPNECFRLCHQDTPRFRADIYGEVLYVYAYDPRLLETSEFDQLCAAADALQKKLIVQRMNDRGLQPHEKMILTYPMAVDSWYAKESHLQYELRMDSGLSPGLFLDQRHNRQWVSENSNKKNILNLFSYTCGFSLAAAYGGANSVVSVDVSGKFLDWGKRNFLLNKILLDQTEFFVQDSLVFLKGSIKRGRKFDLIVCDPPSFSRGDRSKKIPPFSIKKDLPELLKALKQVSNKSGLILFSTNCEDLSEEQILKHLEKFLSPKKIQVRPPALDFEKPGEPTAMKSFLIQL